jgi:hypothetical protein
LWRRPAGGDGSLGRPSRCRTAEAEQGILAAASISLSDRNRAAREGRAARGVRRRLRRGGASRRPDQPGLLRVEPKALSFVKDIFDQKKIVAALCHAPWLLIETEIAKGRKMTSYKSIKTDVINAGATAVA